MQERKNSEAGNEKEVDYGRKSGQDNTSENVIENRPEKRVKNKGGNKTGEFIARKRKERGMTQKEMAELLGVTNKAVSNGRQVRECRISESFLNLERRLE